MVKRAWRSSSSTPAPVIIAAINSLRYRWMADLAYRRRPGVFSPPPPDFFIAATSPVIFRLAVKPSPLATLPSSTPSISGDETSTIGCATMLRIFYPLAASSNSPPLVAGADDKLAVDDIAFGEEFGFYC